MSEQIINQFWELLGGILDLIVLITILVRLHKQDKAIKELQEYIAYKEQWEYEEQQRSQFHHNRNVTPGSAEHYEKWKAERENREP